MIFQKNNLHYFNRVANRYDGILKIPIISSIRSEEEKMIKKAIEETIQIDDIVLDLGCGTGYYTFYLAKRCKKVMANDISDAMLGEAKKKQSKENCNNIEWKAGEVGTISIDEKINKILCIGVLDYVKNPKKLLDDCQNISEEEIILSAPNKSIVSMLMKVVYAFSATEYRDYSVRSLRCALEDLGFKNIKIIKSGLFNKTTLLAIARK